MELPIFGSVIFFSIVIFLFDNYIDWRQYKKLGNTTLSKGLQELAKTWEISPDDYKKNCIYGRDKLIFEIVSSTLEIIYSLLLLLFRIYPLIWVWCENCLDGFGMKGEISTACLFSIVEMFQDKILSIPLSYYHSFVIEERHGFNKKTIKIFITDEIKGTIITLIITIAAVSGVVYILQNTGAFFYLYCELFVFVFSIIIMTIYPNWIAPLFNKFEDLNLEDQKEKEIFSKIQEVAKASEFPLKKLFKIDGSKRSNHSNAYFFGFGKNKRVVLFDTLIKDLSADQIAAVVCHEIGHWKFNHLWKSFGFSLLNMGVIFYTFGYFREHNYYLAQFGFHSQSIFLSFYIFIMLCKPIFFILGKISLILSRKNEYQADSYATNYDRGSDLIDGLVALFKTNKGDIDPDPIFSMMNHSHPTLLERKNHIEKLMSKKK